MPDIKLLNLDCYDYLRSVPNGFFDLLLQDTPFGVTQNDWDIKPDFEKMWIEWLRVSKENAAILFFGTQPFISELILSMPKLFRYDLIWYKSSGTGFLNANRMPLRSHETILVFYKALPTYNPQKTSGHQRKISSAKHKRNSLITTNYGAHGLSSYDSTDRFPESVLFFSVEPSPIHPTQKPIDLIRYLVKTYSNIDDLIFDGYSGSGTTAIACHLENRNCVCCENKKSYWEQSIKRYNEAIKQQTLFDYNH